MKLRELIFQMFSKISNPFFGRGIAARFPLAGRAYNFLYHYIKPLGVILTQVEGRKYYVDTKEDENSSRPLVIGAYERGVTSLFKELVNEGMVVLDIGAHIGYYTLIAAGIVGDRGKVYAFEAAPENFSLLLRNIEVNGYTNVIPIQKAVSNKIGVTTLFLGPLGYAGTHSIYNVHNKSVMIKVEVTSLDEFFKDIQCKIDLIKMDIEGAEMSALEGMANLIKRNTSLKIITEFYPKLLQIAGFSPDGFLNKLTDFGFKLFIISNQKPYIKAAEITNIMKSCKIALNLLCVRDEANRVLKRVF